MARLAAVLPVGWNGHLMLIGVPIFVFLKTIRQIRHKHGVSVLPQPAVDMRHQDGD